MKLSDRKKKPAGTGDADGPFVLKGEVLEPRQAVEVTARKSNGDEVHFVTTCRIDTPVEVDYYRNGGILHTVLRQLASEG